jgi:hypothetical protein
VPSVASKRPSLPRTRRSPSDALPLASEQSPESHSPPQLRLGASAPFGHETTGRNEGVEPPCSLGASSASAARASTSASTSAAASVKPPRPACGEAPRGRGPVRTHVTNPAESALTRVRRRPAPTSPRVAPDRSLGGLDSRFFAAMRRFKSAAAPPGLAAHAGARYRVKAAPAVAQGLPRALPVNGGDFFRRRRGPWPLLAFARLVTVLGLASRQRLLAALWQFLHHDECPSAQVPFGNCSRGFSSPQ